MNLKRKNRLYILADSEALTNCYYVENDTIKKQPIDAFDLTTNSPFLPHNPIGWKDEEINFATSEKYKSLIRSFNIGLTFVYEAAQIIRYRQYYGKGFEEIMYMAILKWDRNSGKYYLEYKGKLDLSTTEDDIPNKGVKVNSIEGGVYSYLTANDSTVYEIPCDESNPAIKQVYLDGMNLSETLNFSFLNADLDGGRYIVPFAFVNNEGDHEGILYGNPVYEVIPNNDYFDTSNNYLFYNAGKNAITIDLDGILPLNGIDSDGNEGTYRLRYIVSDGTNVISDVIISTIGFPSGATSSPFYLSVTLNPGEKLFIYHLNTFTAPGLEGGIISYLQGDLKISFTSRKAPTYAFCISLYDYYKQLVLKLTDGKYTGESAYLAGRTDLVVTCGDALRNTDRTVILNYFIASNFEDCFQSIPGNVGLQVRNNVLYLELLSDLYSDTSPIYDLNEVSDFKIKVATDVICNIILAGYPDQEYETNGGKYEVNSGQDWQNPVLSVKKALNIRSIFRADCRGIERIRAEFTHLDTTDNAGDKEPFLIQVSTQVLNEDYKAQISAPADYTGANYILFDGAIAGNYIVTSDRIRFFFNGTYQRANIDVYLYINNGGHTVQVVLFKNGQSIAIYTGNDTDGVSLIHLSVPNDIEHLNDEYQINVNPFDAGFQNWTLTGATLFFKFLNKPFTLLRLNYDSITGVLDSSVFNVELRPKNQILAHGNEIHGILAQQNDEEIILTHAEKNVELVTEIGGVIVSEKAPIPVSSLAPPLWLPYNFEITTQVPYSFTDLLAMSTAGYFSFISNGIQFYALPIGNMKSTPATNGAQQWTFRAAARNLFSDFYKVSNDISVNFTFNNNMIATSIYSPLHLVKYNFTPQAKYHHIDMHEDWSYHRFDDWFVHGKEAFYTQKWQLTDTIRIPLISSGLGQLSLFVYDVNGNLYDSGLFDVLTAPSVQAPYTLQEFDVNLSTYDEGKYLFVVKAGAENVFISEWCEVKEEWKDTFLFKCSHSANELNLPWLAYNGELEFRVEALFEQWEPLMEAVDYEDDSGDFTVLSGIPLMKRNLIIGTTRKAPEWVGLKINALLLKDKLYIEGETNDKTKHYTRRAAAQIETTKYNGMPYMSYLIEVIPAEDRTFTQIENIPFEEVNGWHATIDAQVFGLDLGTKEITILNE